MRHFCKFDTICIYLCPDRYGVSTRSVGQNLLYIFSSADDSSLELRR